MRLKSLKIDGILNVASEVRGGSHDGSLGCMMSGCTAKATSYVLTEDILPDGIKSLNQLTFLCGEHYEQLRLEMSKPLNVSIGLMDGGNKC